MSAAKWFCIFLVMIYSEVSARSYNLLEVYDDAIANDAKYAASRSYSHIGKERLIQARSGLLPTISFDAQLQRADSGMSLMDGIIEQRQHIKSYGIQLLQPIFNRKAWMEYKQGDLYMALAEVEEAQAEQELVLRVAKAYFDILHAEDVMRSYIHFNSAVQAHLASAEKDFEVGNGDIVDLHEAKMFHAKAVAQLLKARGELQLSQHRLAVITNMPYQSLARLKESSSLSIPHPTNVQLWIDSAVSRNLVVQTYEILNQIAANDVKSRRAERLPRIDLLLNHHMRQHPNVSIQRTETTAIGLRMTLMLFNGGRLNSSEREAAAIYSKSGYELEEVKRTTLLAVRNAWSGVMDGLAQIRALEIAKRSAQSAVDSNRLGYDLGVRAGIDILEVQSLSIDIMQKLAKAKYDVLLAHLQLKAAAGTLSSNDLVQINSLMY